MGLNKTTRLLKQNSYNKNMNYEQFAIWLHGYLEISNAETIDKNQTQIIKDHLALLFEKKTPDRGKKKEVDPLENLKEAVKEWEKNKLKDTEYPPYPPYPPHAPILIPTDPEFNPYKITCSDSTGSPLPNLGSQVLQREHNTKKYC